MDLVSNLHCVRLQLHIQQYDIRYLSICCTVSAVLNLSIDLNSLTVSLSLIDT